MTLPGIEQNYNERIAFGRSEPEGPCSTKERIDPGRSEWASRRSPGSIKTNGSVRLWADGTMLLAISSQLGLVQIFAASMEILCKR
ncbi:MAG: hypothetical protein K2X77_04975, partial [Candidatus Obscuribacterales bacterium]|nr:hypothetical protein [Candidatus Obscuribacterales bacterium]